MTATTLVRVRSHRARHKLYRIVPEAQTQEWFSWTLPGHWTEIPSEYLPRVLEIKGITRARVDPSELSKCVSFS